MSRFPSLDLDETSVRLQEWLSRHADGSDRSETVAGVMLYVRDEIPGAPTELYEHAARLAELMGRSIAVLGELQELGSTFVDAAREFLEKERGDWCPDPTLLVIDSVGFAEEELKHLENVQRLARNLNEAMSTARTGLTRERPLPMPHNRPASTAVLLRVLTILRSEAKFAWPEIADLVIDDYGGDTDARAERYRKLFSRKIGRT